MPTCSPKPCPNQTIALDLLPESPLVSVVVPSFNQGAYIRATIDSILSQDYRPIQIVVVDGASTDQTIEVLKSYGDIPELQWVSEPDRGVVDAVNKGFARVRGDIVAIQSSDDCYTPGAIRRIVEEFASDRELGLLYGNTVKIDAGGKELSRLPIGPYSLLNLLRIKTWIPQPSAFFRAELLTALGGWDEKLPYAPDTDLWLRIAFRSRVKKVDEFLSLRRIHPEQRDRHATRIARDYARMIEQSSDIANAPDEIRKAGHAGKHLMQRRYAEYNSNSYSAWCLLRAGLCDRSCLDLYSIVRHLFWLPIRQHFSSLKHILNRTRVPGSSIRSCSHSVE